MLVKNNQILIGQMQDEMHDYQLLAKWLTDDKVLEFYEGRDNPFPLERIIETYKPQVIGDDPVIPCLVYYEKLPIGYIQYCLLDNLSQNDRQTYSLDETNNVYAIDQIIINS